MDKEWNLDDYQMKWLIVNRVLHGVYEKKEMIPDEVLLIADLYEGKMEERIGWNFPMSLVKKFKKHPLLSYSENADYVILYRKGDIETKRHELQHARYAMDENFRREVSEIWRSFTEKERRICKEMLLRMKYPDREEILLDEFQAYYYTEKPNFFGISRSNEKTHKR